MALCEYAHNDRPASRADARRQGQGSTTRRIAQEAFTRAIAHEVGTAGRVRPAGRVTFPLIGTDSDPRVDIATYRDGTAQKFPVGRPTMLSPAGIVRVSPNLTICRTEYSLALGSVNSVQVPSIGSMISRTGTPPRAYPDAFW